MKSTLFLMEQLIAILIFAVCAAVCVRIFADSFVMADEASKMNNALIIARNGAECYKAVSGDTKKVADILGGVFKDSEVFVYYNEKRQSCEEDAAAYILNIAEQDSEYSQELRFGDLSVAKDSMEEIISFTVAARRIPK